MHLIHVHSDTIQNNERTSWDYNPKGLCGGRPTICGLRIRVQDVLDLLASGASRTEILEDYPYLEDADITASLQYAARAMDHAIIAAE